MANPKAKKKGSGKVRWNLRVSKDLDTWAKNYAFENNTTVTQVLVDLVTDLRKRTEAETVEQI